MLSVFLLIVIFAMIGYHVKKSKTGCDHDNRLIWIEEDIEVYECQKCNKRTEIFTR